MKNLEHFRSVARVYSEKFTFDPYYEVLIGFLEKYTPVTGIVLEIGAANGIVVELWSKVRKDGVEYYSVDPVEEMVESAHEKVKGLAIEYYPFCGNLENAVEVCGFLGKDVDVLVMSRSLHEIYLGYGRNRERLSQEIKKILKDTSVSMIIFGDALKNTTLTPEETARFILAQQEKIGHGHDPSQDYLTFADIIRMFQEAGYVLLEEREVSQPLGTFKRSVWNFGIGVFVRN